MNKVTDLQQFSKLIKCNKAKHPNLLTNSLLLPNEISKLIQNNSLFYSELTCGLVFFTEEERFYRMTYYINPDVPLNFTITNKPVIVEFMYREGQKTDSILSAKNLFQNFGFAFHAFNIRMIKQLKDYVYSNNVKHSDRSFQFGHAKACHASELLDLWLNTLDEMNSAFPSYDVLLKEIDNDNILCIFEKNSITAALKLKIENKKASIWRVAVHPNARRLGLSTLLLNESFKTALNQGCHSCFLWVEQNNSAAIALYGNMGFTCDGAFAEEYILKN